MRMARFGCPTTSRAGSRSATDWRPQPKRRSTPWRAASAISREGPPASRLIDRVAPGWGDVLLLLGRILIGGIFVQSGFDKLMGLDAFAAGLAARGLTP